MLRRPYALFVGDARDQLAAKTANGILQWRRAWCVAQIRLDGCRATLDLPELSVEAAATAGAATLIIGVANAGGVIPEGWLPTLVRAVEAGLDVASGLHQRLEDLPAVRAAALAHDRRLIDVRRPAQTFAVGTGARRPGKRLLSVGTDCSVGKMYTTLAIEAELHRRGIAADFRATGQTGIFIAGSGVSVDAVVADFISGAVEWLTPAADAGHWDLIEGQGSLFHPSFAGVSLGLLHGAQADALVMCHDPQRAHMRGLPGWPLPDLKACIRANEDAARLTNPAARCIGVAVITAGMNDDTRTAVLRAIEDDTGLPAIDPLKDGVDRLVDSLMT